ncbi:3-hydroxyacyl-CoA dehydrogenase NAD-binding domain-containing protein [Paenibacillus chondroitinus]|uniref:3-hydroxyacyl-CoA dehydrogenase NAD-binding domain-containing protein n=1 Tax=Paenibacillus chondroitinus TaxID=59842 RepID=A0ABU6DKY5_9BACL|nr:MULTISPECIES: 3-hydroxyacyl-CoA dehydrogenase/enoyl-CoA hydratase family protein [Paenibacillus]MCY9662022.1 3-hydroxyacyl-CoA dehydrogenase NAD-binding domain-containing protein [Paenibacillus anseongense]MEB4797613.1 3-hydroxyacyl-CoA dehydrogenase NAD-binding domain-containing protein [Paenibacillus chondroitinus]
MTKIRTAAVIGSGVMGSGIAAHLANAGIPVLLLDMVPTQLLPQEEAAGLTLEHPKVRNRLTVSAMDKLKKTNPAPLYSEAFIERLTPGNLEDDLAKLGQVDWIIEVIVENLQAKQQLLSRIETVWKPGTIVSSNTSGISIHAMTQNVGDEFKKHFLGTHFFNPPRYMKLLEVIPSQYTDPAIISFMTEFCEKRLGKGVVQAKDTPNFIANRIGTYGLLVTLREMIANGYSVEEVDAVTGPAMGRPKSATFRTLDLVGLDTFVHVANNVFGLVTDPSEKAVFDTPAILQTMVEKGWIGEKTGQGFYKKVKNEAGKEIHSLDLNSMTYAASRKISSASLEGAKQAKGASGKLKALLGGKDRYSELAWNILKPVLLYSAAKLDEIADSIVEIDNALKWGFNWDLGPFETWDAIGLKRSVERMEAEGSEVPEWVKAWIAAGNDSFYTNKEGQSFYYLKNEYKGIESRPELISLAALKQQKKVIRSNSGANLIDIGDGVACLEFQSPNNAVGGDILTMIQQSVDEVRSNYRGLVVANEGKNFCVGANLMLLLMEAQDGEWDEVDGIIRLFQNSMMKLKGLDKPVVAAPHKMTLGGGVEACMPADQIIFSAETYYGLVEVGVGLIPAGGGCKELALRVSSLVRDPEVDLQPWINASFETVAMAKVSTSGHDTKRLGYMRPLDTVVINPDHRIYEAKQAVLRMDAAGYTPPAREKIRVVGENGKAVMQVGAYSMKQGGYISDHDVLIANKLAHVLAGGNVPAGTLVTEQYLLDLEREAFLSLCGELKTQQRMQYMLSKGKPLRN